MKKKLLAVLATGLFIFGVVGSAAATPIFTNSATVNTVTNSATFDSLNYNTSLLNYTEDGIIASVDDYAYEPHDFFNTGTITYNVHYGSGGNYQWVDIYLENSSTITSMDFMIGDGWYGSTTNLIWETFLNGSSTGFGDVMVGRGSTVGWTDNIGFDSIRVAANAYGIDSFGQYQAIAIDNLRIGATAPVPEPATMFLFGTGLAGLAGTQIRRRKKA